MRRSCFPGKFPGDSSAAKSVGADALRDPAPAPQIDESGRAAARLTNLSPNPIFEYALDVLSAIIRILVSVSIEFPKIFAILMSHRFLRADASDLRSDS